MGTTEGVKLATGVCKGFCSVTLPSLYVCFSCFMRRRWKGVLDPGLNRAPWSAEEIEQVDALLKEHGRSWGLVAKKLGNGRSELMIRNLYYSRQRRQARRGGTGGGGGGRSGGGGGGGGASRRRASREFDDDDDDDELSSDGGGGDGRRASGPTRQLPSRSARKAAGAYAEMDGGAGTEEEEGDNDGDDDSSTAARNTGIKRKGRRSPTADGGGGDYYEDDTDDARSVGSKRSRVSFMSCHVSEVTGSDVSDYEGGTMSDVSSRTSSTGSSGLSRKRGGPGVGIVGVGGGGIGMSVGISRNSSRGTTGGYGGGGGGLDYPRHLGHSDLLHGGDDGLGYGEGAAAPVVVGRSAGTAGAGGKPFWMQQGSSAASSAGSASAAGPAGSAASPANASSRLTPSPLNRVGGIPMGGVGAAGAAVSGQHAMLFAGSAGPYSQAASGRLSPAMANVGSSSSSSSSNSSSSSSSAGYSGFAGAGPIPLQRLPAAPSSHYSEVEVGFGGLRIGDDGGHSSGNDISSGGPGVGTGSAPLSARSHSSGSSGRSRQSSRSNSSRDLLAQLHASVVAAGSRGRSLGPAQLAQMQSTIEALMASSSGDEYEESTVSLSGKGKRGMQQVTAASSSSSGGGGNNLPGFRSALIPGLDDDGDDAHHAPFAAAAAASPAPSAGCDVGHAPAASVSSANYAAAEGGEQQQ